MKSLLTWYNFSLIIVLYLKWRYCTYSYFNTVIGDYINTIKTIYDIKFNLYLAVKHRSQQSREAINQKSFSLIECNFVFWKSRLHCVDIIAYHSTWFKIYDNAHTSITRNLLCCSLNVVGWWPRRSTLPGRSGDTLEH